MATSTPATASAPAAKKTSRPRASAKAAPVVAKTATQAKVAAAAKPKAPKAAVQKAATKAEKAKKPKMVRDSFTIPKTEYVVLDALKARALQLAHPVKKTEVIRAGIKALAAMSDVAFLTAVQAVPNLKTGRPVGAKKK